MPAVEVEAPVVVVQLSCRRGVQQRVAQIPPLPCRCHRRTLHRDREKRDRTQDSVRQKQHVVARLTEVEAGAGREHQVATVDEALLDTAG